MNYYMFSYGKRSPSNMKVSFFTLSMVRAFTTYCYNYTPIYLSEITNYARFYVGYCSRENVLIVKTNYKSEFLLDCSDFCYEKDNYDSYDSEYVEFINDVILPNEPNMTMEDVHNDIVKDLSFFNIMWRKTVFYFTRRII